MSTAVCEAPVQTTTVGIAAPDVAKLIAEQMESVETQALNFWLTKKCPIEKDDFLGVARLTLVEGANEYNPVLTMLPFNAWIAQRVRWRLNDFVKKWWRCGRMDFRRGTPGKRRHLALEEKNLIDHGCTEIDINLEVEDLQRMIARHINARGRLILDLRLREGLPFQTIANVLGISHANARRIYWQIKHTLREALLGKEAAYA